MFAFMMLFVLLQRISAMFGDGFGDVAGGSFFGTSLGTASDPGLVGIYGLGYAGSSSPAFTITGGSGKSPHHSIRTMSLCHVLT